MTPLVVAGNAAVDVIDGGAPVVGGGAYHCGVALRLLERRSRIVAKLAPRDRPLLVPPLAELGVPLTVVDAEQTASFALTYEGEARRTELRAIGDPWRPEDVAALGDAAWIHLAPLVRTDFPAETLAAIARGRRISFDGQGLVRAAALGPLRLDAEFDRAVLGHVSFLKLAEEEARVIASDLAPDEISALGVPEVVVTLGTRGSLVFTGGTATPVPCHPIAGVDVTGCGDVFAVGYLAARSDGVAPVAAARRATALVAVLLSGRKRGR